MSNYIRRQDAVDATWEQPSYTDPLNVLTEVRDRINNLPSADVVSNVEVKALLEEIEKELVKDTGEQSFIRLHTEAIMGIVRCRVMLMNGKRKE